MLTESEVAASPLFQGIRYDRYLAMIRCFQAERKHFAADEKICDFSAPGDGAVGIVERGLAALVRLDPNGALTVLEEYAPGGVFGKQLAFSGGDEAVYVICRKPCEVLFFDYAHLVDRCERACRHHSLLVENMLRLMEEKALGLSERVDVLSRRTTREKLLCYFEQQARRSGRRDFQLPFSFSMLADYIAADRSAMMRELKRMREEGLVDSSGRQIRLLA